jgi:hypothetical protein
MKHRFNLLLLVLALLAGAVPSRTDGTVPSRADGTDLQLKPLHHAETVEQTLNLRFSLENALAIVNTIQEWLESFRRLTAAAKNRVPSSTWKEIGNTEWDVQTLGFANMPRSLEGALRYQNWQLKRALHQLAMMEEQAGKAPAQKVEQARSELELAEQEFQAFWDSMSIAD